VVAATHRKPAEAIAAGILREDLYARLSLWELHVPALRERRVDLHDWLVRIHDAWRPGAALPPLSTDAMETLLLQPWPLNLRSVERLVRDLAARPAGRMIELYDLPGWLAVGPETSSEAPGESPATVATTESKRPLPSPDEFALAFEQLGGNVCALARHFGRERRQIYRWIEAHGVRGSR
jgi:transcriptional regulator of acetoin/glycerol metabolism